MITELEAFYSRILTTIFELPWTANFFPLTCQRPKVQQFVCTNSDKLKCLQRGKKLGLYKVRTGWWRVADGGWRLKNADGKMRMTKWEWKIANDTMLITNSLWAKINLRCSLKVLFVNKSSHLIEFRLGEVRYFIFNHKTENLISLDRIITD